MEIDKISVNLWVPEIFLLSALEMVLPVFSVLYKCNYYYYYYYYYYSYVPVEGWVIDLGIHGLLGSPGDAICLPAYDSEAIHAGKMSIGLAILVDGEEALRCSLHLSPKVLPNSSVYSSLQFALGAFVPVDYPTLLKSGVFILGGHQWVGDGDASFKVDLDP